MSQNSASGAAGAALALLATTMVVLAAIAGVATDRSALMLVLALPVGLAGAMMVTTRPEIMLLIIMGTRAAIDPLLETLKQGGGASPGAAINVAMLVLMVVFLVRHPWKIMNLRVLAWLPFLALAFIAMRAAPESVQPMRMMFTYLTYLAAFAMPFALIRQAGQARALIATVIIASIVPTISGLIQVAQGGLPIPDPDSLEAAESMSAPVDYSGFRIESVFNHPNIYGCFLVAVIAALLYAVHHARAAGEKRWSWGLQLYLLVQVGMLLATQTRSAWVAAGVLFIAMGLFAERRYLVYLVVALPLLMLVPVVQDRVIDAFMGTRTNSGLDEQLTSFAWRLMMWKAALPWIAERPLMGWGLNAYTEYSAIFFPYEATRAYDAHNVFVQLAFEIGIPGAVAFAGMFLVAMITGGRQWRQYRAETVISGALTLGFLLTCYSDNVHHYLVANWYTFFVLGTLYARMHADAGANGEADTKR
ncbi:MAG: O-antigen ligase family protein [Burkholderiaceae bacterium]